MDPIASAASTQATETAASSAAKTTPTAATAKKNLTEKQKTFGTLFAEAQKKLHDGERLQQVKGHQYGEIKGGERDGEFVNLTGNARTGEVFDVITRGGHTFHVYGEGKNRVIVEVGAAKKTGGTQAS